jgi:Fic-DOC domain mobile mystery protein B
MAITGAHAPGATALTDEDIKGLKLAIATHGELNALEAANIIRGQEWALRSTMTKVPKMLSHDYVQELHKRMYGTVWKWAGKYRTHDTIIGVPFQQIWQDLQVLFDDARYWIEHATYPPEEIAIRLHHRLVSIHPFPNGNGRLSRMMADLLLMKHFHRPRLPWGGTPLTTEGVLRADYIKALNDADHHDYAGLIAFSLSNADGGAEADR